MLRLKDFILTDGYKELTHKDIDEIFQNFNPIKHVHRLELNWNYNYQQDYYISVPINFNADYIKKYYYGGYTEYYGFFIEHNTFIGVYLYDYETLFIKRNGVKSIDGYTLDYILTESDCKELYKNVIIIE